MKLNRDIFCQDAVDCAKQLIGSSLTFNGCGGLVVETEAYHAEGDPACHTFFRKSARDFVSKHRPGTAYVYLNYGVHWLFNVLTKEDDNIGFVLLRAIAPEVGIETMKSRRNQTKDQHLCSGPGKLTQALAINKSQHGADALKLSGLKWEAASSSLTVLEDARIGISRAVDFPWRFTSAEHQSWVSRKHTPLPE